MTVAVPEPSSEEVPNWSEETLAALEELTTLERRMVECMAGGCDNAAEAYRRIKNVEYKDRKSDRTRVNAYLILARPRVKKALHLAMRDASFDDRMDRTWLLQRLQAALDKAEASKGFMAAEAAANIIEKIARLKGEITKKHEIIGDGLSKRSDVHIRILEIVTEAKGFISRTEGESDGQVVRTVVITPDASVGADQRSAINGVAE